LSFRPRYRRLTGLDQPFPSPKTENSQRKSKEDAIRLLRLPWSPQSSHALEAAKNDGEIFRTGRGTTFCSLHQCGLLLSTNLTSVLASCNIFVKVSGITERCLGHSRSAGSIIASRYEFFPSHQLRLQLLTHFRRSYGQFRSWRRPITCRKASRRTHDHITTSLKILPPVGTRHANQHRRQIRPRSHKHSRGHHPPQSHNHSRGQERAPGDLHPRYIPAGVILPNQINPARHR
jgi:hypothetical protein